MYSHLLVLFLILFCTSFVEGALKGSMLGFNPARLQATDAEYELMADAYGAGWVRLWELDWRWQRNASDYQLFLNSAAKAKRNGMKVLAVCIGAPSSKSGTNDTAGAYPPLPQYYGEFAQYCAGFVRRGADAVEVWNEPNWDPFWRTGVNLTSHIALAEMTKAVYTAVKAVNRSALVVVGGVTPGANIYARDNHSIAHAGLHYLTRLFTVPGFANSFDVMGLHPYMYGNGAHPQTGIYQYNLWAQIPDVVELVRNHSGNKPLWFTEFGAPSNYYGCSESSQLIDFQQYLEDIDTWTVNNASMIGVVFVWQFADRPEAQYRNNMEGYFGVLYQNRTMKPSGQLLQQWARQELPSSSSSSSSSSTGPTTSSPTVSSSTTSRTSSSSSGPTTTTSKSTSGGTTTAPSTTSTPTPATGTTSDQVTTGSNSSGSILQVSLGLLFILSFVI